MKREDKIKKRQERSLRRKNKRIQKDVKYINTAIVNNSCSISFGRRMEHGSIFICEMRYSDCELRGHCNGDC